MTTDLLPRPEHVAHHAVRFYSADDELFTAVGTYLADGLARGSPVVVIATPGHRAGFRTHLQEKGIDVDALIGSGEALFLDARETLAAFMVDGAPNREFFRRAVSGAVARTDGRLVTAYGEMVDVLWAEGQSHAALSLEGLWNELRLDARFTLLCAYAQGPDGAPLRSICDTHDVVELRASDRDPLLAELSHRKAVERELRETVADLRRTKDELSDFVNNAAFALHSVQADGTIAWANDAELRMLGYQTDEYVGQSIRAFHIDKPVIDDVLERLGKGEALREQPARLRARDGSVRHVLITSNARFVDGQVVSTRCFTRDVTETKAASERVEKLAKITSALADAVGADEVFGAVVGETRQILGALTAGLWLVTEDGERAALRRQDGYEKGKLDQFASTPLRAGMFPALDCIVQREPLWFACQAELLAAYPHLSQVTTSRADYGIACLPLVSHGRALGALAFTFETRTELDKDERAFLTLAARYTAQALERLRLYEIETKRAQRAVVLEKATRAFASAGPASAELLGAVVAEVTAEFAESCGVLLLDDGEGEARRLRFAAARRPRPCSDGCDETDPRASASADRRGHRWQGRAERRVRADGDHRSRFVAQAPRRSFRRSLAAQEPRDCRAEGERTHHRHDERVPP